MNNDIMATNNVDEALSQWVRDSEFETELEYLKMDNSEPERNRPISYMLERAVETIQIGFTLTDTEGKIIYVSQADANMHGYKAEELIGKDVRIYYPQALLNQMPFEQIEEKRSWKRESLNIRKDGSIFPARITVDLIADRCGKAIGIVTSCEDVTEYKRLEEVRFLKKATEARMKALGESNEELATEVAERRRAEEKIRDQAELLNVARDAIIVHDLEFNILVWNNGAQKLYGWTEDEAIGCNIKELLSGKHSVMADDASKVVTEKGEWTGELKQVIKDGKEIVVESRCTSIKDKEGNPKSILIVNTDITEKKALEAQVFHAQRMESIGTLASGIAHDFNNILTPILMVTELLRKRHQDENSHRMLSILESTALRGAGLVKQVLSFGKGIEGKRSALDANQIVLEVEKIVKQTFPKSIEIIAKADSKLWNVNADSTQVHQLLMNLCVNARDAMPEGGALSVFAGNFIVDEQYARMNINAKVGRYVVVSVKDTGSGISPEIMDRIFDPFFTTKEFGKGTGLGLSTVVGLVKSHGGFVEVNSKVGRGTEFKVYLPSDEIKESQLEKSESCEPPLGNQELILVVDDEPMIREVAKTSLESSGYRVITAGDGIEAIVSHIQHKDEVSVVLLDMMMPNMDGLSAIQALKRVNPKVKLIANSGFMSSESVSKISKAGVNKMLSKPYTTVELLFALREVLREE